MNTFIRVKLFSLKHSYENGKRIGNEEISKQNLKIKMVALLVSVE